MRSCRTMSSYIKITYAECTFRIEEEFKSLEDARIEVTGDKADYKIDKIKVIRTLIKLKDTE